VVASAGCTYGSAMPLPELDRASYEYLSSEWVVYAGQLLQHAGYLGTEPTGSYDAELAAAVEACQQANGISFEPDLIGPATWAALGGVEPEPQHADLGHPAVADPGREVHAGGRIYIIYPEEVREGGSLTWRTRNPGAIRLGESYGAYPGKQATGRHGTFAVFPDEATGFAAIALKLHDYGHVTVFEAMQHYAPATDHNDPGSYAATVAAHMNVTVDTYLDTLDAGQLQTFSEAIRQHEGWDAGHTYALDDPTLPPAVQKAIAGH
jgi:putative peptidoglycan binding protein